MLPAVKGTGCCQEMRTAAEVSGKWPKNPSCCPTPVHRVPVSLVYLQHARFGGPPSLSGGACHDIMQASSHIHLL